MTTTAIHEPPVLERARQLVEPALRDAIAGLEPQLAAFSQYHFGWLDEHGQPTNHSGGKGVRSALAILSAEAVGAAAKVAVPGAVAVELIHNFSLLHDDIIDGDRQRRHRDTVWVVFGEDNAIIAGDALHTLAFQVLLEHGSSSHSNSNTILQATSRLATATAEMLSGQIKDMSFNQTVDVPLSESLIMEAQKTGALLGYAASVGALLAEAESECVDGLERYGHSLGLAFQAADDLLGIWGAPETTGKPAGNDLRERKKSLPVAAVLEGGGPHVEELRELMSGELSEDGLTDAQVARAMELLEQSGGRDQVRQMADDFLAEALAALDTVALQPEPKAELAALANFVVARDH